MTHTNSSYDSTLASLGIPLPAQGLLGSTATSLWAVLFADIWQWTPLMFLILLAGLVVALVLVGVLA